MVFLLLLLLLSIFLNTDDKHYNIIATNSLSFSYLDCVKNQLVEWFKKNTINCGLLNLFPNFLIK